jgi:hypothetical protein
VEGTVIVGMTGAVNCTIMELASYSSIGTQLTGATRQDFNMNRESQNTSALSFYTGPNDVVGTTIDRTSGNSGTLFIGRWNLKDDKKYLINVDSKSANNYVTI